MYWLFDDCLFYLVGGRLFCGYYEWLGGQGRGDGMMIIDELCAYWCHFVEDFGLEYG